MAQVERQKREAEALKRQKEEEEQWAKANEQKKADGKEEQTLEDWRKEKKGARRASLSRVLLASWVHVVLATDVDGTALSHTDAPQCIHLLSCLRACHASLCAVACGDGGPVRSGSAPTPFGFSGVSHWRWC